MSGHLAVEVLNQDTTRASVGMIEQQGVRVVEVDRPTAAHVVEVLHPGPQGPAIEGADVFLTLSTAQTVSGDKTFTGDVVVPTQVSSDNSTKAATTAFVKAQNYLTDNQSITFTGDASGTGSTSVTLTMANVGTAGTYTKVTTDAKGRVTSGATLSASDIPTLTAAKISDFDTQVRTSRLDQMAAPTAAVSLNSRKITDLADPAQLQDAATKAYVDAAVFEISPMVGSGAPATTLTDVVLYIDITNHRLYVRCGGAWKYAQLGALTWQAGS